MKYFKQCRITISGVLALFACVAFNYASIAQENTGWQMLFNGQDLSGWEKVDGQHKYEVKDGVIVGTEVIGEPNGFLCTTEYYDDFILELEVKPDIVMENSGIQFRSKYGDEYNDRLYGYQAQIENRPPSTSSWNGAIYDEKRRHWLYIIEDDPIRENAFINNQWNKYRIEAIGTTIRVWINGIPISHLVDVETADGYEPYGGSDSKIGSSTTSGAICLQIHGVLSGPQYEVRFGKSIAMRNPRIQTENLRPSPYDDIPVLNYKPNHISGQEKYQGFELLFDGKTTNNWKGVSGSDLPESGWEIEDGVLTVSGTGNGISGPAKSIMLTEKEYGPFELKFDFKQHNEGGIVGLKYYANELNNWAGDTGGEPIIGKMVAYAQPAPRNPVEWNSALIRVLPNNWVEYWVNGYKILDYQRDSSEPARGHILLDAYDTISYRSIKIREL